MLTVNTPLTLLLASLTLASEGLHCSTIRCLQALGEKDMAPALYLKHYTTAAEIKSYQEHLQKNKPPEMVTQYACNKPAS